MPSSSRLCSKIQGKRQQLLEEKSFPGCVRVFATQRSLKKHQRHAYARGGRKRMKGGVEEVPGEPWKVSCLGTFDWIVLTKKKRTHTKTHAKYVL